MNRWLNPQFIVDSVNLIKEIFHGKLHFFRSSSPGVFLGKGILKICSKFAGEHLYRSLILIMLQCNVIEITFGHRCSPVNLLHIFRTPFTKNTSGRLFLFFVCSVHGNIAIWDTNHQWIPNSRFFFKSTESWLHFKDTYLHSYK